MVDIVAGGKGPHARIAWFQSPAGNPGDLSLWRIYETSDVGWTVPLIAHDMDADGDLEVITTEEAAAGGGRGVIWYENPTRG